MTENKIKTVLFHRAGKSSQAFLSLFDVTNDSWDDVLVDSGLRERSTSRGDDSEELNNKIKNFLLGAPERCVNGMDFKPKWKAHYGTQFPLPDGVKLTTFLGKPAAAGACRLELQKTPEGGKSLIVHAPDGEASKGVKSSDKGVKSSDKGFKSSDKGAESSDKVVKISDKAARKVGDRVQAKYTPKSHTWKDATVVRLHPGGDPELLFDEFHDIVSIPLARIRTVQVEPSAPKPLLVDELKMTLEKARWLLNFEASREKLASAKFDGVKVNFKDSVLKVCIRDRGNDEQNQAATELVDSLRQAEANLEVSETFSLSGAVIDELLSDLEVKRLEREERVSVFVIRPKKGADSTSTDAPAGVRLVSDSTSNGLGVARVQEYLSETYTSVEREVILPRKVSSVSFKWLEQQILQPAEARHQVKISPIRFGGSDGGKGRSEGGGGNFTPALNNTYHLIKKLLLETPERCIDGKYFKPMWSKRYGTDLVLPDGVKLKQYLEDAEAAGACRIEMRKMPNGPDDLFVHAPREGNSGKGGKGGKSGKGDGKGFGKGDSKEYGKEHGKGYGKGYGKSDGKSDGKGSKGGKGDGNDGKVGNTYQVSGVPWRVGRAIADVEAIMRATEVKAIKKNDPLPELVAELHKMRKDLLSSGGDDDEGDDASTDSSNKTSGRLLITVFAPPTPGVPPPYVKVTLAMAPSPSDGSTEIAVACAGASCTFLRHSAPPPLRFTFENALFCCSKCHLSPSNGTADSIMHGEECEQQLCGTGSSENDSGGYATLKAARKSFQALIDTFGQRSFLISNEFPKQIDASAASNALEEKLGGHGKASEFAANCGLVKVEWNKKKGEVLLTGDDKALGIGVDILAETSRGAIIETVNNAI